MFDSFNRSITYLRISVTDRCNLRCLYCMPEDGIRLKTPDEIISYEAIIEVVQCAVELGIKKIRLTGGEPLVRKGIASLIVQLKRIPGLDQVAMTSNGILLSRFARELKEAGLDRINISLDTLDPVKYRRITRIGDIKDVLAGIASARKNGFSGLKLNMVLIPGFNTDEVGPMKAFCLQNDLELQRINHYNLAHGYPGRAVYRAERPRDCRICNRIRLTADGKLKPCLFSDLEYPVDFKRIKESIAQAIKNKPRSGSSCRVRQNWQIGG